MDQVTTPPIVPQPLQQASQPVSGQPAPTPQNPSSKNKNIFIFGGIIVILLIAGISYYFSGHNQPTPVAPTNVAQSTTSTGSQSPTVTPVTASNVDQALNNTNTKIQNSINQANTDLNDISNIDTTQDNVNNL